MTMMLNILNFFKEYGSLWTPLVALIGVFIAKRNLRLSSFKNEFDIFMKLDEKYNILFESMLSFNSAEEADKQDAEFQVEQAMERYFNTLDTICLYVLKGNINRQIFYRQYGEIILQLSEQEIYKKYFTKSEKGYYDNIYKVVNKLKKKKSKRCASFIFL